MNTEEARLELKDIENNFSKMIVEFEKKTGLVIECVDISRVTIVSGKSFPLVEIDARLLTKEA